MAVSLSKIGKYGLYLRPWCRQILGGLIIAVVMIPGMVLKTKRLDSPVYNVICPLIFAHCLVSVSFSSCAYKNSRLEDGVFADFLLAVHSCSCLVLLD